MIEIREYLDKDLDSVNNILKEAFNITKKNFNHCNMCEVVGLYDGNVCGYLLLTKVLNPIKDQYYCLVDYVCVSSKYRGLGISDKMMDYAYSYAKSNNCMYLQLTCGFHRTSAHKLYERCGYVKRESDIYRKVLV